MGNARSFTAIIKEPAMPQYRLRWNSLLQLVCMHRFTHDAPETHQSLLQESEPFAMNFTSAFQGYHSQRQWPYFISLVWLVREKTFMHKLHNWFATSKPRYVRRFATGDTTDSLQRTLYRVAACTPFSTRAPPTTALTVLWNSNGGIHKESGNSGLTSCRLVNGYRRYGVASWSHLQFLSGLTISSILFPQLDR